MAPVCQNTQTSLISCTAITCLSLLSVIFFGPLGSPSNPKQSILKALHSDTCHEVLNAPRMSLFDHFNTTLSSKQHSWVSSNVPSRLWKQIMLGRSLELKLFVLRYKWLKKFNSFPWKSLVVGRREAKWEEAEFGRRRLWRQRKYRPDVNLKSIL